MMEVDVTTERLTENTCSPFTSASDSHLLRLGQIDDCSNNSVLMTKKASHLVFPLVTHTESPTQIGNMGSNIIAILENETVWSRFHSLGTEMILTKQGRRMFPCCRFKLSGLDLNRKYALVMDITPLDAFTHKWNGSKWEPAAEAEPHIPDQVCVHPESPALGQQWMESPVSFYKVKLASNFTDEEGSMFLQPMRRYQPRLHVIPVDSDSEKSFALDSPKVQMFTFSKTEFYAVTSYQNPLITQLKIDCNPFAMAFRKDSQSIRLLQEKLGICPNGSPSTQPSDQNLTSCNSEQNRKQSTLKEGLSPWIERHSELSYPKDGSGILSKLKPTVLSHLNDVTLCKQSVDFSENDKPPMTRPALKEYGAAVQQSINVPIQEPPQTVNGSVSPVSTTKSSKSLSEDAIKFQISNESPIESVTHSPVFQSHGRIELKSSAASLVKPTFFRKRSACFRRNPKAKKPKNKWWSNAKYAKRTSKCTTPDVTLQPDLEDVEGMLFVSFSAKEALDNHVENMKDIYTSPPPLPETQNQSGTSEIEAKKINLSVEERISQLEHILLLHLKQYKHKQVIHPHLQEVGMKLSLLDPNISIDLSYLGVRLPFTPCVYNNFSEINSSSITPFPDGGDSFECRTGKTNDPTKIKGWRERFNNTTVQIPSEGMRNNSAFCSDLLDEYLENEAQQISDRAAVFSQSSSAPISYQLPSKGSSYVVTLNSRLQSRSTPLNRVHCGSENNIQAKPPVWRAPRKLSAFYLKGPPQVTFGNKRRSNVAHSYQNDHASSSTDLPSRPGTKNQPINPYLRASYGMTPGKMQMQAILQEMEEEARSFGKVHTHITTERASFALNALLTSQKFGKSAKNYIRHFKTACPEEFCRLGCICDSLKREIRGPTHCRRVQCMFDCSCFKHKVLLIHPPKVTTIRRGRKRSMIAFPISDPEVGERPPPATNITTLWKKRTAEQDPEPLFVPNQALSFRTGSGMRNYVPRLTPQIREEDKDPVYLFFESKMTCARVREYNSNPPPQVHMFPGKMTREKQADKINDCFVTGVTLASQKQSEISATEVAGLPKAAPAIVRPDEPVPTKLLEILSECNWEPHRNLVLSGLFGRMSKNLLSEPFCLGTYKIQLLSTTVKKGDNPTITYKVCVSRATEMNVTSDVEPVVKKRTNSKARGKQTQTKTGTTVSAPVASQRKSNPLLDNKPRMLPCKNPSRIYPLLSHVLSAGCLKAQKKKSVSAFGLIKVNGKAYNQAKLSLGQMGALHPANRVAAFVTGRLQHSRDQGKASKPHVTHALVMPSVLSLTVTIKPAPSASQPLIASSTSEPTAVATKAKRLKATPLNTLSKLVVENTSFKEDTSLISPGLSPATTPVVSASPTFVHPAAPPFNSAGTSSAKATMPAALPPGVLQHLPGVPGSNFLCQYNGKLLQLMPVAPGPIGQSQVCSVEGGSPKPTSQPKVSSFLHKPLNSSLAKSSLTTFPMPASKVVSLSGSNGMNFASGTPAINLKTSFPGKAGTFSFRICPPNTQSKPAGSQQDPKLPDPLVVSPPALKLPGGFTVIKLPLPSHPGALAVPADVPNSVSGPAELQHKGTCTEKLVTQNCSHTTKQTCRVSESCSKPSVAETLNSGLSQMNLPVLSQSDGDGAMPSKGIGGDQVVKINLHSVNACDKTNSDNCDMVSEAAVMISKSEHVEEKQASESSSDPSTSVKTSNSDSTRADAAELGNGYSVLTLNSQGEDQLVEKTLETVNTNNKTAGGIYDWVPVGAQMLLKSDSGSECEEDQDNWPPEGAERVLWMEDDSDDEEDFRKPSSNVDISACKERTDEENDFSKNSHIHEDSSQVVLENKASSTVAPVISNNLRNKEKSPDLVSTTLEPSSEPQQIDSLAGHLVSEEDTIPRKIQIDSLAGHLVSEEDTIPRKIPSIKKVTFIKVHSEHSKQSVDSENSPTVHNNEEHANHQVQTEPLNYSFNNIDSAHDDEDVDIDGDVLVPLLEGQTPAIFTLPEKQKLKKMTTFLQLKNPDQRPFGDKDLNQWTISDWDPDCDNNLKDLSNDEEDSIIDSESTSNSELIDDGANPSSVEDNAVDIEAFENGQKKKFRQMKTNDQERPLTHTEKERVRRGELRHSFASLKAALNIEEQIVMCKHDILIQAHLMIQALEDRKQTLEERKKALLLKQSAYISTIAQFSGKSEEMVERNFKENWVHSKDIQNPIPASVESLQINPQHLDSDGNLLPPRLGNWKFNNYTRKGAEQSAGHRGRRRRILRELSEDEEEQHVNVQNLKPVSVSSPQINSRLKQGEGNRFPSHLGPWKSINYLKARSEQSAGHKAGRGRKILSEDEFQEEEHFDVQNLESISVSSPQINPRRQDNEGNQLPPRLGLWKSNNCIRNRSKTSAVTPRGAADESSSAVLPGHNLSGHLPSIRPGNIVLNPSILPKLPSKNHSADCCPSETGPLPKIVLFSFDKTDTEKLEKTSPPSFPQTSKSAEHSLITTDLKENEAGMENCISLSICNETERSLMSEESNGENLASPSLTSEYITENKTWPQLEQDKHDTTELVNVDRRRSARQREKLRNKSTAVNTMREKTKKVIWMRCGDFV